jgi:hypothetical protein
MGYSCIGVGFVAFFQYGVNVVQIIQCRVIVVQNIQYGVIVVQFIQCRVSVVQIILYILNIYIYINIFDIWSVVVQSI